VAAIIPAGGNARLPVYRAVSCNGVASRHHWSHNWLHN
jgi:hypothetical protein